MVNVSKNKLIELKIQAINYAQKKADERGGLVCIDDEVDYFLANNVTVPPVAVGDEIWVIDREDGAAVDISCIQFLAVSKGCIIGTAWINDLDIDETIQYHINETRENFDTDLKVYPIEDCFMSSEEAEAKLNSESM